VALITRATGVIRIGSYTQGGWNSTQEADFRAHAVQPIQTSQREPWLGFRCVLADDRQRSPPPPKDSLRQGGAAQP
jgi:hypothetical protein